MINVRSDKKAFTLLELIVVIACLIFLMAYLVPKISGAIAKTRDTGRIKVAQEFETYYEDSKKSIWVYPGGGVTNVGSAISEKALAKKVTSGTISGGKGHYAEFDFSGDRTNGLYATSPLKEFQEYGVASATLGSPADMKRLLEGEKMIVFTSKTSKRVTFCIKLYGSTEASMEDGDGIPDDKDPDGADGSQNWSRIFVSGNMKLWEQLGSEAKDKCKALPDPREL